MPYSRSRRSSTSCTHSGETRDQKWTIPNSHSTRIRLNGTASSHNKMGRCSPSCRGCGWNDWTRKTPNVRSMSPAVRWADIPGRRKCVPHVSLCNGMMRCAAGPPYHERCCYRRFTATGLWPAGSPFDSDSSQGVRPGYRGMPSFRFTGVKSLMAGPFKTLPKQSKREP